MQYPRKLRKGDKVAIVSLSRVIDNEKLPIVCNVNFGHAAPRCTLQYGVMAKVDMKQKKIFLRKSGEI